ncbi:sensor histidine kinase [Actinoplanes subtropicus]|uniref:sensor histidine kinase n=1 Tax=Actinoplanes subtropicus TaxID=543632 RepID=UPI0004C44E10|nr:histidine kinase [Actinoplanes subtropicus]
MNERDRIAADLHDHIIQRLFAAGLALQGAAARMGGHPVAPRVAAVIDDLDDTIAQIRSTIFAIQHAAAKGPQGLRARVLELVTESAGPLGCTPALRFSGPVDTLLADAGDVVDDLTAVLRESLSNVARHARAGRVEVDLIVESGDSDGPGRLTMQVCDDGVGLGASTRSSGTANLRHRAEHRGGTFTLGPNTPSGTCLKWSVPI